MVHNIAIQDIIPEMVLVTKKENADKTRINLANKKVELIREVKKWQEQL